MSIEALTAAHFRELGQRLTLAAEQIESGSPVRDVDPRWELIRAVSSLVGGMPTFEAQYTRESRDADSGAASALPIGNLILEILTVGKSWTGTVLELESAGAELGIPTDIDLEMFRPRHWFNRGISSAGALVYVGKDGLLHLERHQWFSLAGRTMPSAIESSTRPARNVMRGAWISVGIDPDVCIYCQSAPFQEIEHFVPRSRGGSNDLSNLFPSCIPCNRGRGTGKHDREPWEWLAQVHPLRVPYFQTHFGVDPEDN